MKLTMHEDQKIKSSRNLLRRMVNDIKQKVNHIIFATATPMRTHPDEYYYLLELLGIVFFLKLTTKYFYQI